MQPLPAMDSQQNIKNEPFIYDHVYLSNYIWAPENGGKMVVIPKLLIATLFCVIFLLNPLK